MILKIILIALCANLLYTNASLMIEASAEVSRGMTALMVFFALTYSLISTLSLFKLQSAFTAVCFAILDGFAVYSHLSVHGENFKTVVGVYFGIYTTYTLIVAYIIKRQEDKAATTDKVDGHDAAYWYKCFLFQKDRADKVKQPVSEITEPTQPQMQPTPTAQAISAPTTEARAAISATPTAEPELPMMQTVAAQTPTKKPFQIQGMTDDEARELLSVKRAFARVQDTDKRRARAAQIQSETVKAEICRIYGLNL